MKNKKSKLHISISREHKENLNEIKEIFNDFEIEADAGLMRFSAEDLPMQIVINIGGAIASGITWDLLKAAIKKTYQKFSKSGITIRDNDSIMYAVKSDLTVVVIVVPDRQKEFEHIRKFDDLAKHIEQKK
ncbi:MAG TPA: hypothetical protein P5080_02100 [Candidatus Paceibacterota bacterium]|nr:hypothetical protein [Candidatus Pacearchaeota archaeon]HRZ50621.1 hypothetical protein [Candidatus Paceibacterota bacterium]HSA36482.1 hypothetical protein [Candidatus Paceibacterota bacterium]